MIGRLAGDKELLMPLTFNLNSAVEAGFHWETGGIKKCRILRVSVPLPIAHVDGTVPFPDSIRKRDGLRIFNATP